jgi:hypothetical protein
LRRYHGITAFNTDPRSGVDRGGILWDGVLYRVIGSTLYSISEFGTLAAIGTIAGAGQCSFAYSFDRLAIAGGGNLYYYNGSTLNRVTDADLGRVDDVVFVDGYFLTTDGEFIVQTELNDPTQVDPLKYGSSEVDPDPIKALLISRNELVAINRYTTEFFNNAGGTGFAFVRVEGAMIEKGCVGTHARCHIAQSFAFVGGGRNEPPSVYLAGAGQAQKVATAEIERQLSAYTEDQLSGVVLESREANGHQHLLIHLPDQTLVYDVAGSAVAQQPLWFVLSSAMVGKAAYRGRRATYAYGKWIVGDAVNGNIGYLDESVSTQYGEIVGWQFECGLVYGGGRSAQIHAMELVSLQGRAPLSSRPQVFMSYSEVGGVVWSQERIVAQGQRGQYSHRLTWRRVIGRFQQTLGLRFRGCDDGLGAYTRLDVEIEGLNV